MNKSLQHRFEKFFNVSYNKYAVWYGFDLLRFEEDFIPNLPEGVSIKTYLTKNYGKNAVKVVSDILDYESSPKGLNISLSDVEEGDKVEYVITHRYSVNDVDQKSVEGYVHYPFALRKIKRGDWAIDHLPSGYYLKRGMNKAAAKKLLQQLEKFQLSCRKPILADDVLEELKKVVESFS